MTYKRFLTAALVFACLAGVYGFISLREDTIAKIRQQLDKWANEQPVEKVYLHLDKPYYAAGDDIWFKAYVVSGAGHQLSNLSGIVNVELTDEQDSVKRSVKLHLSSGTAYGDFALPDTLHAGNYRIRAYTNYMRNAGSEYFFNKAITIINPLISRKEPVTLKAKAGKVDVQFFPEGGDLVNGIATKVAFKAVAPNGLGIDLKGTITDSKGQVITRFTSTHLGMGVFGITPAAGITYTANITYPDGTTNTVALPGAIDDGFVLNIDDSDPQNLKVKVTTPQSLFSGDANRQLTLVAQNGGKIYYTATPNPGSAVFTSFVPQSKFPSGITQFTLFSDSGEPLCERLVYIQSPDQLNLTVTADKDVYPARGKVKIFVNAKNGDGKPVAGNFSVAITDETKVPADEDTENNIFASLLLTSDLRGYVEQPAWYFNHPGNETRAALDVLMLTQGYHRFEWKQLLNNDFTPQQYHPENSMQLSGTVLTPAGKPAVNAMVTIYDLDSIQYSRDTVTDDRGRFIFKNLTYDDSVRLIVQARSNKNKKDVNLKIDNVAPPAVKDGKTITGFEAANSNALSVYAQGSQQLYAEQRRAGLGNHVISLQEVVISEKKQLLKYSANLNGPGNADQIVQWREILNYGCLNIADCLEGRLLGVIFRNGIPYTTRGYGPMQVVVDGVYVDGGYLNSINFNDIQAIEVLRNIEFTSIYGGRGANGIMLVTSRHGNDIDYPQPIFGRGITTYYPKGYEKAREFYSPQYDQPKTNKQLADLRTTIFWKPDLPTGNDGKTSFEFFNAGSAGNYRVVIEGIDGDGHIGRQVYYYKVQ